MFCNQCEQTFRHDQSIGCTLKGVCGKMPSTAALQNVIIYALEGLSVYLYNLRKNQIINEEISKYILYSTFSTLTNVNFDDQALINIIKKLSGYITEMRNKCNMLNIKLDKTPKEILFNVSEHTNASLVQLGNTIARKQKNNLINEDIDSLRNLILYGIKGICAYAHHASILDKTDHAIFEKIEYSFYLLAIKESDNNTLLNWAVNLGSVNFEVLKLLNDGHLDAFGTPQPTKVNITAKKGKAILVSGHDLKDLEAILKATEDTGINVYTHGEMLPGNSYPKLSQYKHLIGNYGGAWQNQHIDFAKFPGAIIVTSNCIQKPMPEYENRLFTTGPVGWPGIQHISDNEYKQLIDSAMKQPGFNEDEAEKQIMVGFGKDTVLSLADKIIDNVKSGSIRRFYLIGGCDGAELSRNYFTEIAEHIDKNSIILTLGCAKYRFNKQEFGDINGIPRLLDIGQCNDSYSAIQIAIALANAFQCSVNELPLSFYISWLEQKAVAVFLTLLYLGITDIHLGPKLPGFLSQNILNTLIEKYNIKPTTNALSDLQAEAIY
ncbi:MAG: hydroxylamine reductase [Gammaproteobacteria bacterium]|nr:MAG: hydroxylamine reductase [Gammaproteobacteria bacterium]UTW41514.1 hydroxylamine reductase [bacterium SCSIO 12844]